jgi:hypothetical protein
LQFQLQKLGGRSPRAEPQFRQIGDDKIVGSTWWLDHGGRRVERFQVITFRDGRITDLQGCSSRREAERVARRH